MLNTLEAFLIIFAINTLMLVFSAMKHSSGGPSKCNKTRKKEIIYLLVYFPLLIPELACFQAYIFSAIISYCICSP